jgi:hypothetical protein
LKLRETAIYCKVSKNWIDPKAIPLATILLKNTILDAVGLKLRVQNRCIVAIFLKNPCPANGTIDFVGYSYMRHGYIFENQ